MMENLLVDDENVTSAETSDPDFGAVWFGNVNL